jgi:hypothetical protein
MIMFLKLQKPMYKSPIAQLKGKGELNRGNGWRGGEIGGNNS